MSGAVSVVQLRLWIACVAGGTLAEQMNDTRDSLLGRAVDRSEITYRTFKDLYYGKINAPRHPAVIALRDAARHYEFENLAAQVEYVLVRLRALSAERGARP